MVLKAARFSLRLDESCIPHPPLSLRLQPQYTPRAPRLCITKEECPVETFALAHHIDLSLRPVCHAADGQAPAGRAAARGAGLHHADLQPRLHLHRVGAGAHHRQFDSPVPDRLAGTAGLGAQLLQPALFQPAGRPAQDGDPERPDRPAGPADAAPDRRRPFGGAARQGHLRPAGRLLRRHRDQRQPLGGPQAGQGDRHPRRHGAGRPAVPGDRPAGGGRAGAGRQSAGLRQGPRLAGKDCPRPCPRCPGHPHPAGQRHRGLFPAQKEGSPKEANA